MSLHNPILDSAIEKITRALSELERFKANPNEANRRTANATSKEAQAALISLHVDSIIGTNAALGMYGNSRMNP